MTPELKPGDLLVSKYEGGDAWLVTEVHPNREPTPDNCISVVKLVRMGGCYDRHEWSFTSLTMEDSTDYHFVRC